MSYTYYAPKSIWGKVRAVARINNETNITELYKRKVGWVADNWLHIQMANGSVGPKEMIDEATALDLIAKMEK